MNVVEQRVNTSVNLLSYFPSVENCSDLQAVKLTATEGGVLFHLC